jgi:hypothetical protein
VAPLSAFEAAGRVKRAAVECSRRVLGPPVPAKGTPAAILAGVVRGGLNLVKTLREKMARTMGKPVKRPKRRDSYAALDRRLKAALQRRSKEIPRDRQRAFGRVGRRPPGVLDGW